MALTASLPENPLRDPSPRRRLDYVDALRGMACLWVLLHHALEHHATRSIPLAALVNLANIGWLGVSLFLVLSGFCLYYPLARKFGVEGASVNIPEFARRRVTRLLPPYYVALAFSLIVGYYLFREGGASPLAGWKDIPTHLLMLHNLSFHTFGSINPVFWSLALEAQLYVIFPLLVFLARRGGMRTILLLTLIISLLWQIAVNRQLGYSLYWTPQLAARWHALPARCFEFAAGMCAASLVAAPRPRQNRAAVVLICALLAPSLWFALRVARFGPMLDQSWGIIFACLLVLLARIPNEHFETRLPLRALVGAGYISYSVYLIHMPIYNLLEPDRLHWSLPNNGALVGFYILRGLLVVAIGALFFRVFEKPAIRAAARNKPRSKQNEPSA